METQEKFYDLGKEQGDNITDNLKTYILIGMSGHGKSTFI
jgi:putative ribosome biogenesis GTPase RsgA